MNDDNVYKAVFATLTHKSATTRAQAVTSSQRLISKDLLRIATQRDTYQRDVRLKLLSSNFYECINLREG